MLQLNPKETRLLKLICDDKSNPEIAAKLDLSLRQTERLKSRLYKKTKTSSGISLLKWAVLNKYYALKK